MMFFWGVIIIVLLAIIIRSAMNYGQSSQRKESPTEILKRRYANGEIDEAEFQKRRKELLK